MTRPGTLGMATTACQWRRGVIAQPRPAFAESIFGAHCSCNWRAALGVGHGAAAAVRREDVGGCRGSREHGSVYIDSSVVAEMSAAASAQGMVARVRWLVVGRVLAVDGRWVGWRRHRADRERGGGAATTKSLSVFTSLLQPVPALKASPAPIPFWPSAAVPQPNAGPCPAASGAVVRRARRRCCVRTSQHTNPQRPRPSRPSTHHNTPRPDTFPAQYSAGQRLSRL